LSGALAIEANIDHFQLKPSHWKTNLNWLNIATLKKNFGLYTQTLIEQDIARLKQLQEQIQTQTVIELTEEEKIVYNMCLGYAREYGDMKYGGFFMSFAFQPEQDLLWCLLGDVRDTLRKLPEIQQFVIKLKQDENMYNAFYEKISTLLETRTSYT
jgi:hypothetical protein